jgi:hypothetical protein
VGERLNPEGEFEYFISVPNEVDEMMPIIAGECLFNIRSALDHLLCALIPGEDKGRAQFPIFTQDPLAIDPLTGNYRDSQARGRWLLQTKNVPSEPLAVITELQPFNQAGNEAEKAQHHSLAVLSTLQNADKHRQLVYRRPGLKQTVITSDGAVGCIVPALYDGAKFLVSDHQVDVQAEGVFSVPFGIGGDVGYEYPITFNKVLDLIARDVLPGLEQFLPPGTI